MFEQPRSIINRKNMGLPLFLFNRDKKYNSLWGTSYLVFLDDDMNEIILEQNIESMMSVRALGKTK